MTYSLMQTKTEVNSFKPKRQNLYIAISPELLILPTIDLRTEFRPRKALRGWSPSWISENVNNSELDRAICAKVGGQMHHAHADMRHGHKSKPELFCVTSLL